MKSSTRKWDESLMEDLRDPALAQEYVKAALEEGVPLQVALADVVRATGYEKVAKRAHMARPNLVRAIRANSNPTFATMQKLLKSIGLDISVRQGTPGRKLAKAA